jgi:hypothetical protein
VIPTHQCIGSALLTTLVPYWLLVRQGGCGWARLGWMPNRVFILFFPFSRYQTFFVQSCTLSVSRSPSILRRTVENGDGPIQINVGYRDDENTSLGHLLYSNQHDNVPAAAAHAAAAAAATAAALQPDAAQ